MIQNIYLSEECRSIHLSSTWPAANSTKHSHIALGHFRRCVTVFLLYPLLFCVFIWWNIRGARPVFVLRDLVMTPDEYPHRMGPNADWSQLRASQWMEQVPYYRWSNRPGILMTDSYVGGYPFWSSPKFFFLTHYELWKQCAGCVRC